MSQKEVFNIKYCVIKSNPDILVEIDLIEYISLKCTSIGLLIWDPYFLSWSTVIDSPEESALVTLAHILTENSTFSASQKF